MVITNVNQVVYQGDGVTTAFPFTFRIIDATDIKLLLLDSDGTETDITSDYFVDTENDTVHYPGYAPGAEPALSDRPPVLAEGQKLVIYRKLPITQEKDLGDKWPFYVIELGLDKLTMILQDIWDWLGRCLCVSKGQAYEAGDAFDPTIPLEADKVICGNANATGFDAREALMEVNGHWDGEGRQLKGVAEPTDTQDAATKNYVDTLTDNNFIKLQPNGTAWEGRNLPISNVGGPVGVKDVATKDYVDSILNGFVIKGDSRLVPLDTVEQMISTDLSIGQIATVLGYKDINDNAYGYFNIRASVPGETYNGYDLVKLDNNNVAERIASSPQRITIEELETVQSGIYTLGKVTVNEPIMLAQRQNRNIMIVDSDITINTSIMMPNAMGDSYFSLPMFANCIFRNGTNGRVALFGDSYFVGNGFTDCKFLDVDCVSNGNSTTQAFVFVNCYLQSYEVFLENATGNVQVKFIGCNAESECKQLVKSTSADVFMSGTYEGNRLQGKPYLEIDRFVSLKLDSAYFEEAYVLDIKGDDLQNLHKSAIYLSMCFIGGRPESTFYPMTFGRPDLTRIYIYGCAFAAYGPDSRFTDHSADEFLRVEGMFLGSTAETFNYPFNGVDGRDHKIAILKDVNALERVQFYRDALAAGASRTVTLPLGNYIVIAGVSTNDYLTTANVSLAGACKSSITNTNVLNLIPDSSVVITATKANADDTTFTVSVENNTGSPAFISTYIIRLG